MPYIGCCRQIQANSWQRANLAKQFQDSYQTVKTHKNMFHSTQPYLLNINIKVLRTIQSQSSQLEPHFELLFGLFAPHGEELGAGGAHEVA